MSILINSVTVKVFDRNNTSKLKGILSEIYQVCPRNRTRGLSSCGVLINVYEISHVYT